MSAINIQRQDDTEVHRYRLGEPRTACNRSLRKHRGLSWREVSDLRVTCWRCALRTSEKSAVPKTYETYRYSLGRIWDDTLPHVLFVLCNPSIADIEKDDKTMRRCAGFAIRGGYGGFRVVNLFAFRATDPSDLWRAYQAGHDVVGPDNDAALRREVDDAGAVCVAWGPVALGRSVGRKRASTVIASMADRPVVCLGTARDGVPRHPLVVVSAQGFDKFGFRKDAK